MRGQNASESASIRFRRMEPTVPLHQIIKTRHGSARCLARNRYRAMTIKLSNSTSVNGVNRLLHSYFEKISRFTGSDGYEGRPVCLVWKYEYREVHVFNDRRRRPGADT